MGKTIFETLMGAIVLLVAVGFVITVYRSGAVATSGGYKLQAKFDRADGLAIGSDVRVSGLKVGAVTDQTIDTDTFLAVITVSVDDRVKLPTDTTAEIVSDGLLGGKYISLVPGAEEATLNEGDTIQYTQSSINIESLIGKFMFGSGEDNVSESAPTKKEDAFGGI